MIRLSSALALAAAALTALAQPAVAQNRGNSAQDRGNTPSAQNRSIPDVAARHRDRDARERDQRIPPGHMPPPGMCRVWIDGVPPGRQSPPTDCATARRNVPRNGRVIYGESRYDDRDRDRDRNGGACRYPWDWMCDDGRDRDRDDDDDGWGNDRRRGDDYCLDRDRDGRCDYARGRDVYDRRNYPSTLPRMIAAVMMGQGIRSPEASRWLGDQRLTARYTDRNRDRVPERAVWLDAAGRVVQVWIDADRDGRADQVELYRSGRRVQVIR